MNSGTRRISLRSISLRKRAEKPCTLEATAYTKWFGSLQKEFTGDLFPQGAVAKLSPSQSNTQYRILARPEKTEARGVWFGAALETLRYASQPIAETQGGILISKLIEPAFFLTEDEIAESACWKKLGNDRFKFSVLDQGYQTLSAVANIESTRVLLERYLGYRVPTAPSSFALWFSNYHHLDLAAYTKFRFGLFIVLLLESNRSAHSDRKGLLAMVTRGSSYAAKDELLSEGKAGLLARLEDVKPCIPSKEEQELFIQRTNGRF